MPNAVWQTRDSAKRRFALLSFHKLDFLLGQVVEFVDKAVYLFVGALDLALIEGFVSLGSNSDFPNLRDLENLWCYFHSTCLISSGAAVTPNAVWQTRANAKRILRYIPIPVQGTSISNQPNQ